MFILVTRERDPSQQTEAFLDPYPDRIGQQQTHAVGEIAEDASRAIKIAQLPTSWVAATLVEHACVAITAPFRRDQQFPQEFVAFENLPGGESEARTMLKLATLTEGSNRSTSIALEEGQTRGSLLATGIRSPFSYHLIGGERPQLGR